jgi:putative heme iron utilization protein
MIEQMRFRVVRSDHTEATLDWDETVDVLESGQWMSIQVLEEEGDDE